MRIFGIILHPRNCGEWMPFTTLSLHFYAIKISTGTQCKRKPQVKTIPTFQPPISPKKSKESKRVKTAQMLIREDNGKGLRAPPPLQTFDGTADPKMDVDSPAGFLRPAGVDAPAGESKPPSKRGRDPTERHSKEDRWPRKKKKKTATS